MTEEMYSKIEKITPAKAQKWLEKNQNNRPISDAKVAEWQSAMERGEWQLTHQGIALDPTDNIVDGQHRLWAIVYSGTTVQMMVTYNAPPETKSVVDVGRKRTAADVLAMQGETNSNQLAGALRILDAYWRGFDAQRKQAMSHEQMMHLLALNPELRNVIKDGAMVASKSGMTVSPASAGCYLIHSDPDYGQWMRGMTQGIGLYDKDPRIALRSALLNALRSRRKRSPEWQLALYGKAWLAFKQGRQYNNLNFKDTEGFPMFGDMKHTEPAKG